MAWNRKKYRSEVSPNQFWCMEVNLGCFLFFSGRGKNVSALGNN